MTTSKSQITWQFGKVFRIIERNISPQPYSLILENKHKENALLFESNVIAFLSTQEVEAVKRQYSKLHDAFGCLGILEFRPEKEHELIQYLVTVTGCMSVGKTNEYEIYKITQTEFVSLRGQRHDEDYVSEVRKFLQSGSFYFSRSIGTNTYDISLSAQRYRLTTNTDNRFFWNRIMHTYFIRYGIDTDLWLFKILCGNFEIKTVYIRHRQARACIISRLSCERAGTRFNVRGCNDDGHVANFVETEQVIHLDDMVTSYLQTRGSVPLFWEQTGVQVGSHKVKLSRGLEYCSSAYEKHFETLKYRYGNVLIVNLLSSNLTGNRESEATLNQTFQTHHSASKENDVGHITFDYHSECRSGNTKNLDKLKNALSSFLAECDIFFAEYGDMKYHQKGVIRTNCLDCLDRTNCVQSFLGLEILPKQLKLICQAEYQQVYSRFEEIFKQMWVNNGNEISRIYAGTGAIQGGSKLMDGARSAARTIQNNLLDSSKQEAIDILLYGSMLNSELGDRARMLMCSNTLYAPSVTLNEVCKRYKEFTFESQIRIAVGTYNVNGGKHFRSVAHKDESLSDWLLDAVRIAKTKSSIIDTFMTKDDEIPVDIFAIGFEEIVDLNAGNIMAASSENANLWAEELQKVLSRDQEYPLLTYIQLVGVCLFVFVKRDLVNAVTDVAVDSVKTGLGGAAGNKGAVAIRFNLYCTSFCFVCSHFAAGQSQVNDRNADYAEITKKLEFPMGRTLNMHDYIFWCGDFNYRIDMDKDQLKEYVKENRLDEILQYDQLMLQKKENKIFQDFIEGQITFPPTYKYDLFSDDYDTSEKCRAPAWTDRVLWKRNKKSFDDDQWNPGRLIHYGRTELKQSDHRPVLAIVEVDILSGDPDKRDAVFKDVVESVGPLDGTVLLKSHEGVIFDDDFMNRVLQILNPIGEIKLIRFVDDTIWVTFKNGRDAISAVNASPIAVSGCELHVALKCENWFEQVSSELNVCSDNTVPLYVTNKTPENLSKKIVPPRPRSVTQNKPPHAAGVFSIPVNLHQPLKPTVIPSAEKKVPVRPAPPPPGKQSGTGSSASFPKENYSGTISPPKIKSASSHGSSIPEANSTALPPASDLSSAPPPVPRRKNILPANVNPNNPPPLPARSNIPSTSPP